MRQRAKLQRAVENRDKNLFFRPFQALEKGRKTCAIKSGRRSLAIQQSALFKNHIVDVKPSMGTMMDGALPPLLMAWSR